MSSVFKHNGYIGSIETSVEDDCLFGKLLFVRELVTYEAQTISGLKSEFEASVANGSGADTGPGSMGAVPQKACG